MTRVYAALALVLLVCAGVGYYGHTRYEAGVAAERAVTNAQAARFEAMARAAERAQATHLADAAAQYEKEKADAQAKADRTIADLRAGAVRLRREWQGCPARAVPRAPAGRAKPDADAQLRSQGASDLVRLAAEADAQIRGLQAALKAERKP